MMPLPCRGRSVQVAQFRLKAMHTIVALLKAKPEQEALLLGLLVNKLGDMDKKVAARTVHLLNDLLYSHGAMKPVVVREVENVMMRPNFGLRAQYYAIVFLTGTPFPVPHHSRRARDDDDAMAGGCA